MALAAPDLDDRRFDDIVAEARTLDPALRAGVDRPQRQRSGHRADQAVCLDDRADALPAQPGAGAQLHQVPAAARDRAAVRPRPAAPTSPSRRRATTWRKFRVSRARRSRRPARRPGADRLRDRCGRSRCSARRLPPCRCSTASATPMETTKAQAGGQWFYPFGAERQRGQRVDARLRLEGAADIRHDRAHRAARHRRTSRPRPSAVPIRKRRPRRFRRQQCCFGNTGTLSAGSRSQLDPRRDARVHRRRPRLHQRTRFARSTAKVGDVTTPLFWIRCRLGGARPTSARRGSTPSSSTPCRRSRPRPIATK